MGDLNRGETMTMAPIVVKDRVHRRHERRRDGRARLDRGDSIVDTGKEVWRGYNIGPDADMKVERRTFKPFYAARAPNLALDELAGRRWKQGGAPVWGWLSYDPELDLVYHGTATPAPWNGEQRPGDNKWTASDHRPRRRHGEMRWAFQPTPHDMWDYDATNENILVDLPIGGQAAQGARPLRPQRLRLHHRSRDRRGAARAAVRADELVHGGRPRRPAARWSTPPRSPARRKGTVKDICPSLEGGRTSSPPLLAAHRAVLRADEQPLHGLRGGERLLHRGHAVHRRQRAGEGRARAATAASSSRGTPPRGKKVWGIKEPYPVWGGALATAGGVVFYGTLDGWFKAADARTGEVLWKFKVGSGVVGNPITYTGPTASSTSRCTPASAATWASSSPGDVRVQRSG